jgi:hypothetical protein
MSEIIQGSIETSFSFNHQNPQALQITYTGMARRNKSATF